MAFRTEVYLQNIPVNVFAPLSPVLVDVYKTNQTLHKEAPAKTVKGIKYITTYVHGF